MAAFSDWVRTSADSRSVARDGADAVAAAMAPPGRVATLILPADASWNEADGPAPLPPVEGRAQVAPEAISDAARVLRSGEPAVLFMGGHALREPGLMLAGRIAAKSGARLLAQTLNARVERGAGRVAVDFLPTRSTTPATLAEARHLVLVGTEAPVAFFAYPDKPSVLSPPQCETHTLARPGEDIVGALEALTEELGASQNAPVQARENYPPPTGKAITPDAAAAALGMLLPEGAIVVDEALSAAPAFMSRTRGAASHDYLQVTGGAIGIGLPLATGAAVACPDRKVICLQADGSAMYTVQALDPGTREPRRHHDLAEQSLLRDPQTGAGELRRGGGWAQGTRHDGARPAGTRLGRPRPRHGRGGGTRQDDGGSRPAVCRQSALRGPVSDRPRAVAAPSPPLPPKTCSARRNLVYRPSIVRGSMRSSRSGFTPGAKSSSPMGCREHTSLPRGYAEYLIVCITSISPLQRRSPDRAPGGWFLRTTTARRTAEER